MKNKVFYHTTYNMDFAIAALSDGWKVHCCHPEGFGCPELDPLTTREDIEDVKGHLFLLTFNNDN